MNEQEPLDPRDSLWKLLGAARKVEPSPYFVRRVLREARQPGASGGWLAGWLHLLLFRRGLAAALACALAVAAVVFLAPGRFAPLAKAPLAPQASPEVFDPASEMAAVEYLGQLMAVADPGQLDDDALADLFF